VQLWVIASYNGALEMIRRYRIFIFRMITICVTVVSICCLIGCSTESENRTDINRASAVIEPPAALVDARKNVERFFKPMGNPQPGDWLATFHEPGQTFEEYLNSNPTLPTAERNKIYVLPLGDFTAAQRKVIDITAAYIGVFYDLDVDMMLPKKIPHPLHLKDSRIRGYPRVGQVRSGFILDEILRPILPPDAAALIAFTNDDLFPDETMNFVFGQASFENRVGVYSLFRLDDRADLKTFLLRTIKIAAHETGHMFSIHHCRKYECVMSGSNGLEEVDRLPLDACPECMAKICWLSNVSPAKRYQRLAEFCRKNGMNGDAKEFEEKLAAVGTGGH
jgi:archaemetzincin